MTQLTACSTVTILLLCVGSALGGNPAATGSITTSFAAGAAADGNMFDVTTFNNPVTVTDTGPGEPQMHYVVGIHEFSNAALQLNTGVGIGGMFGYFIKDRTWSGTLNYTVGVTP